MGVNCSPHGTCDPKNEKRRRGDPVDPALSKPYDNDEHGWTAWLSICNHGQVIKDGQNSIKRN